ncbi:hypothetical protein GCM10010182_79130 [Actinomadura cremea]|nr:hypothetical protein GCM10010182_79130 [Actinomadura cremea]
MTLSRASLNIIAIGSACPQPGGQKNKAFDFSFRECFTVDASDSTVLISESRTLAMFGERRLDELEAGDNASRAYSPHAALEGEAR